VPRGVAALAWLASLTEFATCLTREFPTSERANVPLRIGSRRCVPRHATFYLSRVSNIPGC
jgi:hypothetical protein